MTEKGFVAALGKAREARDVSYLIDLARVALGATCGHELWDGCVDDPSYAYCDMPSSHAGPHHYVA